MSATLTWDGAEFAAELAQLTPAFRMAGAAAINRTLEEHLRVQREKIQARMTVRNPAFILPPVQLPSSWRATPKKLEGLTALGNDEGRNSIGARRVAIMSKFEKGKERVWGGLDSPLYIPTKVLRPTPATVIPRALYPRSQRTIGRIMPSTTGGAMMFMGPKAAGVKRRQTVTVGKLKLRQQDRSFVLGSVRGEGPAWGVYERYGPGKGDIRMLWAFMTKTAGRKLLTFQLDAQLMVNDRFEPNLRGALDLALAGNLYFGPKR